MTNLEKVVVDGETLYVDHATGKTKRKMSKEEFRNRMIASRSKEEVERIQGVNKRAMEQWEKEQQKEHDKDNAHIKRKSSGGSGNAERDSFLSLFNKNLSESEIKTVQVGKTVIGLDYNGSHYELRVTKKNKPIESFENLPGKVDKVKYEIFNIILKDVEDKIVLIKNEVFIRTSESDFQIRATKKKNAIEGL